MRIINKIALTIVFDNLSHWTTMLLTLNQSSFWFNLDLKIVEKTLIYRLKLPFGRNNIDQPILNIALEQLENALKFLTALGTTMHIINRGIVPNRKRLQAINTAICILFLL